MPLESKPVAKPETLEEEKTRRSKDSKAYSVLFSTESEVRKPAEKTPAARSQDTGTVDVDVEDELDGSSKLKKYLLKRSKK